MTPLQHILYVDDEPELGAIAQLALEQIGGYRVTLCQNGTEALAAVAENRPQLALLDVLMPDMDGPQLLAELRATPQGAELPVIFLTGRADDQSLRQYQALGALGTIAKPFDPMTLSEHVQTLWERQEPPR